LLWPAKGAFDDGFVEVAGSKLLMSKKPEYGNLRNSLKIETCQPSKMLRERRRLACRLLSGLFKRIQPRNIHTGDEQMDIMSAFVG